MLRQMTNQTGSKVIREPSFIKSSLVGKDKNRIPIDEHCTKSPKNRTPYNQQNDHLCKKVKYDVRRQSEDLKLRFGMRLHTFKSIQQRNEQLSCHYHQDTVL